MAAVTDMFIDMSNNPGFRRAEHRADYPPDGVLFGGLRELSALTVEDGADVRDIVEPRSRLRSPSSARADR